MDHGVAVWTHGTQVTYRVHFVLFTDCRKGCEVMNVNHAGYGWLVDMTELEVAGLADCAIVSYAVSTCSRVPFIPSQFDPPG